MKLLPAQLLQLPRLGTEQSAWGAAAPSFTKPFLLEVATHVLGVSTT